VVTELRGRFAARVEVSRAQHDRVSVLGQAAGDLSPEAAIASADERDALHHLRLTTTTQ
jgi:hypothetical protein